MYMLVSKAQMENAKNQLGNVSGVTLLECETDDAWARDVGATMVLDEKGAVCGVDWQFNAWGGTFDGLYRNWEKDDRVAAFICRTLGCPCLDARPLCWRAVPSILTERDSDRYRGLSSESGTQSSDEQGTDRGTVEVLARCPQDYLASMWNLSG